MSFLISTIKKFNTAIYYIFLYPFYYMIFKKIGKRTRILKPLRIEGFENISLGDGVVVGKYTWLASLPITGLSSILEIGDGTRIGNFNHIYATSKIVIGRNVLTADKVYISDNQHTFESITLPVWQQPIKQLKEINIGDGTWIGENVCILGASIGTNCVIGANSVLNRDIPDFCVVVGSPAKIVKRYCKQNNKWLKTNEAGDFN